MLQPVQKSRAACRAFIGIIEQAIFITNFNTELASDFGVESDSPVVANIITGYPLKGIEGVARAEEIRFLPNHKRIENSKPVTLTKGMVERHIESMGLIVMACVACRFILEIFE